MLGMQITIVVTYKKNNSRYLWNGNLMFFDKVSLVTGGFDPIHSGHIAYFKEF